MLGLALFSIKKYIIILISSCHEINNVQNENTHTVDFGLGFIK